MTERVKCMVCGSDDFRPIQIKAVATGKLYLYGFECDQCSCFICFTDKTKLEKYLQIEGETEYV